MRIIGLTGSIACGKSTVSDYLVSRGIPVVDGDRISRKLTEKGSPVLGEIYRSFGSAFFHEDGSLNRRRLGQRVFSDPSARKVLDDLMAPWLLSETKRQIEEVRNSGAALCVLDMPLLFEKGYDRLCDTVWTVWLPENIQLARLMERDGYTREEALERIHSVLSSDEKAALSEYVVDNTGSRDQTFAMVSELLSEELRRNGTGTGPRRPRALPMENERDQSSVQRQSGPPEVMERPEASRTRKTARKAAWRMPVWLKSSLIAVIAVLLIGTTSVILMEAYLTRCRETHEAEQKSIDAHYPVVYRDLIEQYADEYNLSPAFVTAIILNESSFDPRAESGVGARGLMQLMPDTAEWIAGKVRENGYAFERMYDPASNIRYGCWYLNYLSNLFLGDPVAVAAAYHAGQGQVKIWLSDPALSEDGFTLPLSSLPEGPTKNYVRRVTRDYGIYQEKYFSVDQYSDHSDPAVSGSRSLLAGNR